MDKPSVITGTELHSVMEGPSFPNEAFGHGTIEYQAFLLALLEGLQEYLAQKGGVGSAPSPLPAA